MSGPLNIIFAGTPDFAASHLAALLETEHKIVAVYTQPDRPSGRGRKLTASPVKQLALEHDIPVEQPLNFKQPEQVEQLKHYGADIMIVVAYGIILPADVLNTPRLGCINVHGSLLPRWRGAAPIHRALLASDSNTGVTIMQMDEGLDTGDMLYKADCPITARDTSGALHDRLAELGSETLVTALNKLVAGELNPEPQDESQANYAEKLQKAEGQIDWQQSAQNIDRQIRGLNPWPVAYCQIGDSTLRVWQADIAYSDTVEQQPGSIIAHTEQGIVVACGEYSALALQVLQLPGSKALASDQLLNSRQALFAIGETLS